MIILNYFVNLNGFLQALIAGIICFLFTSFGSCMVLFSKYIKKEALKVIDDFSVGIMLSATFFSLLFPATKLTNNFYMIVFSFIIGCIIIFASDILFDRLNKREFKNNLRKSLLLFFSITLHNFPEGLVVGTSFGGTSVLAAISLTIGIAIQNFPEGAAVSFSLYNNGVNKYKATLFGVISGIVEPIAAIFGYLLTNFVNNILPVVLSLAAGVMLYVILLEFNPNESKKKDLSVLIIMLGFCFMMFLEFILD